MFCLQGLVRQVLKVDAVITSTQVDLGVQYSSYLKDSEMLATLAEMDALVCMLRPLPVYAAL